MDNKGMLDRGEKLRHRSIQRMDDGTECYTEVEFKKNLERWTKEV
jgi:hypothetical protein